MPRRPFRQRPAIPCPADEEGHIEQAVAPRIMGQFRRRLGRQGAKQEDRRQMDRTSEAGNRLGKDQIDSHQPQEPLSARSEERRVGKECVRTSRSRGSPDISKKKKNKYNYK